MLFNSFWDCNISNTTQTQTVWMGEGVSPT